MSEGLVKDKATEFISGFLEHHGVKGQRWGVRTRTNNSSSSSSGSDKSSGGGSSGGSGGGSSGDSKPKTTSGRKLKTRKGGRTEFKKKPSRLSDQQLQDRIKRMELEKKYADLNKKDVSAGKKFTNDVMSNSGKAIVGTLITGGALYLVAKGIERNFGAGPAKAVTGKDIATGASKAAEVAKTVTTAATAARPFVAPG